jgi:hypothetical protein
MFIYSIGCSITSGYGLNTNYTKILASYLNAGWMNVSRPSVGNDWIFHNALETLIDNNPIPDLVIVQWSSPMRRVHMDLNETEWYVTIQDHSHLQPKWEPMGSLHTVHYMYCMQEWLEKRNMNYIFIDYFGLDESVKKSKIYSQINWDKFIHMNIDHFKKEGMVWDDFGHPNIKGSYYIVEKICEKLDIDVDIQYPKSNII